MAILKPLSNYFLFKFVNTTRAGKFVERNSGQIILTNKNIDQQGKYARFGEVTAVGKDVKDFTIGDIVLIEPLMWTQEIVYNGESIWKSDDTKVLGIAEAESVTYAY
jgi:hypothetical protein